MDLLFLLAEMPYPCIWTFGPVIKALLATSIMHFEATPIKDGKPNPAELSKLDILLSLLVSVSLVFMLIGWYVNANRVSLDN